MKKNLVTFARIAAIILYLVAGIGIFFMIGKNRHENMIYLGVILVLMGAIEGLIYFSTEKRILIYCHDIIIAVFEIAIGTTFIIYNKGTVLTLNGACVIWGVLEITKSLLEGMQIAQEIKHIKFHIVVDIILTLICFVFGILLCIHVEHGIMLHLYITAASLLVWALTYILRFFVFQKEEKEHEKD